MDSSFLTLANIGLGLYSTLLFLKMLVQFGIPNHPVRFTMYLVAFCAAFFFCGEASTGLGFIEGPKWADLRALPMVVGSLALLLQTIMLVGEFSLIQQKVVSRLPLIAGLIVLTVFPNVAWLFFTVALIAGCLFLTVSHGKGRYQKRMFFKMILFMGLFAVSQWSIFLFFVLFYLSLFEQAFGVAALMDEGVQG